MLFAGHYSTAERPDGAVVIYYSDDGGQTFQLSASTFPRVDESVVTGLIVIFFLLMRKYSHIQTKTRLFSCSFELMLV